MRTLLVDCGLSWRGGQQQVALLASGLAARAHEVRILAPPGTSLTRRTAYGPPVGRAFSPRCDLDVRGAWSLQRVARAFGPTIVHAHDARAHGIARLAQAMGMRGRLVVTRRVTFPPAGRAKYRRGVQRYIAISQAVRRSLEGAGIPGDRIDLIPSGVDLDGRVISAARDRPPWPSTGDPVVLILSALTSEKDVGTAVLAAAIARGAGLRARWVVAGDGPERAQLEALAAKHRAPITFAGFLSEPARALTAADVLVHTPLHEGLGTALLQAMACGVPVVATEVGGIPEIVTPALGTLVPPRDPWAVAAEVGRWIADPARRRSVRQQGPGQARRFGVSRMVEQTLATYTRALQ